MNIEERILALIEEARTQNGDRSVGENISPYPELKIAFDGYGENEDEEEDPNFEKYVVYIHKDALTDGFEFPEHETTIWAVVHRPKEEVCYSCMYDVDHDFFHHHPLEEFVAETELSLEQVTSIVEQISSRK